jgi:hypothetical protein
MSRLKALATGLAILVAIAVAARAQAATPFTVDELQRRVERIAPPYPTLPGKVPCACPQSGVLSRAVGYLNSVVTNHGGYRTVDVWCAYHGFGATGQPSFTTVCADYRLLK